jgi:transcriptional regulator with XRE-family HTH domain
MQQGRKLRALYRSLGWSRRRCAEFLHLDEKTLRNWEAGRHAIPFSALELLRLHLGYRLPGAAWRGWSISRGKLCTPEGHELDPGDTA